MRALWSKFLLPTLALTFGSTAGHAEVGNPRVNQLGYGPYSVKIASVRTTRPHPQRWTLMQGGKVITRGWTTRARLDAASGDRLARIDFSAVHALGSGFVLKVGADRSHAFSLGHQIYRAPLYDALKYFYHNRSGVAIETPHTGGGRASYAPHASWARPAGHVGLAPNQGDHQVPCWPDTCTYALDASKGWYDGGDHGKYVVNAGITLWTLMHMVERTRFWGSGTRLDDSTLNIPESGNGVADILDEIRWELEFVLAMQVPEGQALAGMVHHKMHDRNWTGLPLAPHLDAQPRALVPPSTAATLNLAATAAQAARLWRDLDPPFARRCLQAARSAWDAAHRHPVALYRGGFDTGGGPYDDDTVKDDFYWAAIELFLTTGDSTYLPTIDHYVGSRTNFDWAHTELAGLVSLATVPGHAARRAAAQQRVVAIAEHHRASQQLSGYGTPLLPSEYAWGSNNAVTNKLMLMAMAYHFSGQRAFADGVTQGLDYLLGRNHFSRAFVTGTGAVPARYPHHRFWAAVLDAQFPMAPPGALVGGPNPGLQDPVAKAQLAGCVHKPATCWKDDIQAYSVNEVTINWNAPLAWLLDFQTERLEALADSETARNTPPTPREPTRP